MFRKMMALLSILTLTVAVGFVAGSVTATPTHADNSIGGYQNASQYCSANSDFDVGHGYCVSFFSANPNSSSANAHFCQMLTYPVTASDSNGNLVTLRNRGDCMQYLKSFG